MEEIKLNSQDPSYLEEVLKPINEMITGSDKADSKPVEDDPEAAAEVITIKQVAEEFGTNAKALRKVLRDNGFKKVGKRWEWEADSLQLEEIRQFLSQPEPEQPEEEIESLDQDPPAGEGGIIYREIIETDDEIEEGA
jgi:hypothetical protein